MLLCKPSKKLIKKLLFFNKLVPIKQKLNFLVIKTAIYYIKSYHKGQKRHSGEPFYFHPIEVASTVADYIFNTETIVSALLHDVVEDTSSYLSQIDFIFGARIAEIVNTLTKISCNLLLSKDEVILKINSFRDFNKQATTIKVIDRLHNMRTINYLPSMEKKKIIAQETMKFYVPLAKYAELNVIAEELQNRAVIILNV